jgi:hypothetical protein
MTHNACAACNPACGPMLIRVRQTHSASSIEAQTVRVTHSEIMKNPQAERARTTHPRIRKTTKQREGEKEELTDSWHPPTNTTTLQCTMGMALIQVNSAATPMSLVRSDREEMTPIKTGVLAAFDGVRRNTRQKVHHPYV